MTSKILIMNVFQTSFGIWFAWRLYEVDYVKSLVRNHIKLLRVINSRWGFSKGTVLYGG